MTVSSVGQTVKCAIEVLRQFHRDLYTLVNALDQQMNDEGWYPTLGNKISTDLGNSLQARSWTLEELTRIYACQGQIERTSQVLAFSIVLAPTLADEPICLVVGARFSTPVSCKDEIWDQWDNSDGVLAALPRDGTSKELERKLLDEDFLPRAQSARAFVIPLCSIVDAESVAEKLVAPALALLR
jgi:hypothetical protein